MLKKGINFLVGQQVKIRARLKRLALIQTSAFSILAIYALGVAALFASYFWFLKENRNIQNLMTIEKNRIAEDAETEMKHFFLKDKLASLVPIFESKRRHQQLIEAIFSLLPAGISINGFTIDESGDINFSGEAREFSALESFLARLRNKNITPDILIDFAEVNSVRIKTDGGYGFSVVVKFIHKGEA